MEWSKTIETVCKLPNRYAGLVALVSGMIVFVPESAAKSLRIDAIRNQPWFGIVFLVFIGLFTLNAANWSWSMLNRRRMKNKRRKHLAEVLNNLDPREAAILREFYLQGRNALTLPIDDPTVENLLMSGVLIRIGTIGHPTNNGIMFSCAMSSDAKKIAQESHLQIPDFSDAQDLQDWILERRPFQESRY